MHITTAHLPLLMKSLEDALRDQKDWLAFDSRIQYLSVYDLTYFDSANKAADFQLFNHGQDIEVILLPVEALHGYVVETAREQLREGKPFSPIEIDDEKVLGYFSQLKFDHTVADLEEMLGQHDWKVTVYEPLVAPVEGAPLSEIMPSIQIEFLMEQLSRFAKHSDKASETVQEMVTRHWGGTAMEKFIPAVLSGRLAQQIIFHQQIKTESMTQKNQEYLQNQLKAAGFNESIFPELEKNMSEGKEKFELTDSLSIGKDHVSAILHFAKSDKEGADMYFFNKYEASLHNQTINASQMFFINNKGQSIDLKEANNLLAGRSVYKEVTPKDGDKYKAWLKLDYAGERDEHGNIKMQYYNQKYGFDLKEAIGRLQLKEMGNPDKMEALFASLQKGNLTDATLIKNGKEMPVQLTTDPKFKTLKMYDAEGTKLFVPGATQEAKYGKAPVDEKRAAEGNELNAGQALATSRENVPAPVNGTAQELKNATGVTKKKDLLPKKERENSLMPKKRVRKGKGQGVA